jgi:hypothetical protein
MYSGEAGPYRGSDPDAPPRLLLEYAPNAQSDPRRIPAGIRYGGGSVPLRAAVPVAAGETGRRSGGFS